MAYKPKWTLRRLWLRLRDAITAPTLGVDYAWAKPVPANIAAAGYRFVVRYLSNDVTKNISSAEAAALLAAGLDIGLVWEDGAENAVLGATQGTIDGQKAVALAKPLPHGPGAVIFANVGDFAAAPSQMAAIAAYYDAFANLVRAAGWTPGGYGTGWILDQLAASGRKGVWWQNAMDNNGVSGSQVQACSGVYQRVSPTRTIAGAVGEYDENIIVNNAVVPFWTPNPTPVPPPAPPKPTPVPTPTEVDSMIQFVAKSADAPEYWLVTEAGTLSQRKHIPTESDAGVLYALLNQIPPQPKIVSDGYLQSIPGAPDVAPNPA